MRAQLTKLARFALDLVLPQSCLGCGQEGELICPACRPLLPRLVPPLCPRCGLPLPAGEACPDCGGLAYNIDGMRAPFAFAGLLRRAVHEFKYQNLRSLARPLARELAAYLEQSALPAEVLVPVPLHPRRLRERGYNQAALLAAELGRLTGLPVREGVLVRRTHTPPQVRTAGAQARYANMAAAFACAGTALAGKRALLIDDVATTGATLDGCARVLKEGGAASVWGLTLAREVLSKGATDGAEHRLA